MLHAEIGAQRPLQPRMHITAVGQPLTLPNLLQVGHKLVEFGQEGLGYTNLIVGMGNKNILVLNIAASPH